MTRRDLPPRPRSAWRRKGRSCEAVPSASQDHCVGRAGLVLFPICVAGTYVFGSTPGYTVRNLHAFFAKNAPFPWLKHTIYVDCGNCYIGRHPYAGNGEGCTLWRRAQNGVVKGSDHCDFIFDLFCGSFPKFPVYELTCPRGRGKGPVETLEGISG
ncbi:uncharacterized protein LOC142564520 [Dermacentor variabilis]|uniref:uncharacterized protein LOC142564520 n=1 Tax=Dermacentor variabilis TaxID=34621 RepID=UPI003F5BFB84